MSFVSDILGSIDRIRGIHDEFGLCTYGVTLRVTTWTNAVGDTTKIGIGRGVRTDVNTPITLANGKLPKVRRVSHKETIAGGGKYQMGDFRIGPFTPPHTYGGLAFSSMAPVRTGDARTSYHFVLTGPDLPARGMLCEPVEEQADHPLHRYLIVRPSGSEA